MPLVPVHIDLTNDTANDPISAYLRDVLTSLCARIVPDLGAPLDVDRVSGGLTNTLFRCASADGSKVIVRVFGAETDKIIDRQREREVGSGLTRFGFGKVVYGEFENGRIEEYIAGRALLPNELTLPGIAPAIAKRLAQMHSISLTAPTLNPGSAAIWSILDGFVSNAEKVSFTDTRKEKLLQSLDVSSLKGKLATLRQNLAARKQSPIVLAHNDLLSGNILVDRSLMAINFIQFIDFEYAAYNFRAFDIANHFCECCGFDCDWTKFPSVDSQVLFMRHYLAQSLSIDPPSRVSDRDISDLIAEVRPWVLVSHMFWGFWGVVQASQSPIDFDFLSYAKLRFDGFNFHYEDAIKL